ncbi:signal recognition particle-docking protein FtsY [Klebsiella variicola]|uniref:Signal recognition particle-docking protein FtsY n=1 Tax=Klebsiella variicola TaxID=244366 RepID=A0A7H4M961_KLEVA|nr:signal recognition particle-docking protein FtsY [Klebsiella variicola]
MNKTARSVVANGKKRKNVASFPWLGFGQKEQAQETETEQKVEEQQAVADESPVAETPAEPSAPKADPEAFAEDVVEVTEMVVESEKAHLAEPASVQEKEWVENACSGRRRACC